MNAPRPDDDARDAHLLAALRHTPDRDALPPAPLTAAILDRARQAVRPSRATAGAWGVGLRAALARLWQPAPMAAFGTLAMATLIGVMWGGQPVPDATPELRPEQAAPAPQQAPAVQSEVAGTTVAQAPPPVLAVPETARPEVRASKSIPKTPATSQAAARAKAATPPAPPPEAMAAAADAVKEREGRRDAAGAVAPQRAAAPAPVPQQSDALAKSLADAAPAALRARSERAVPALGANAGAVAAPLAGAAAEIDAAAGSDAARVRWRLAGQRLVAHEAAQREWWAAVQRATQGRWQLAATASATGAESEPIALLIDGVPRGSLAFEPQAVVWRDAGGVAWRAPIAAATLRAWQEAQTRW